MSVLTCLYCDGPIRSTADDEHPTLMDLPAVGEVQPDPVAVPYLHLDTLLYPCPDGASTFATPSVVFPEPERFMTTADAADAGFDVTPVRMANGAILPAPTTLLAGVEGDEAVIPMPRTVTDTNGEVLTIGSTEWATRVGNLLDVHLAVRDEYPDLAEMVRVRLRSLECDVIPLSAEQMALHLRAVSASDPAARGVDRFPPALDVAGPAARSDVAPGVAEGIVEPIEADALAHGSAADRAGLAGQGPVRAGIELPIVPTADRLPDRGVELTVAPGETALHGSPDLASVGSGTDRPAVTDAQTPKLVAELPVSVRGETEILGQVVVHPADSNAERGIDSESDVTNGVARGSGDTSTTTDRATDQVDPERPAGIRPEPRGSVSFAEPVPAHLRTPFAPVPAHWTDDDDLAAEVRRVFRLLPPVAWDAHVWTTNENAVAGELDRADAHALIGSILVAIGHGPDPEAHLDDQWKADAERWREHSVMLNALVYRMATVLGDVTPPAPARINANGDYPLQALEQIIAAANLPDPNRDRRPHSRACGMLEHPHGARCHSNCPTCHGRPMTAGTFLPVDRSLAERTRARMEAEGIPAGVEPVSVPAGTLTEQNADLCSCGEVAIPDAAIIVRYDGWAHRRDNCGRMIVDRPQA